MGRLEGTTLDVIWKGLGWFTAINLGLQLRRFVKILRSVISPTAGSLATGECRSFWLEDRYGLPANSGPAEMAHFRFWTNFTAMRRAMQASKQPQKSVSSDSDFTVGLPLTMTIEPFVLTHHDLAPRNLPSFSFWSAFAPRLGIWLVSILFPSSTHPCTISTFLRSGVG
ncbi:uncharacterized protein BDV17DRAFT_276672 [Aspergillus undulatus]|uniref:uncharacterized protein n=1 Tax=Aspergillus undulatus TaxID=1810928 RepID=UPI003CCDF689